MIIDDFIRLEVRHQGFDLDTAEGQSRVKWMAEAWAYAMAQAAAGEAHADELPVLFDILALGALVEQEKNANGFRIVGVQVGGRPGAPSFMVLSLLVTLLAADVPPLEFYKQFQLIHPFEDGNGRTGKILLCWLNGTLGDPEMPPDLFGGGLP